MQILKFFLYGHVSVAHDVFDYGKILVGPMGMLQQCDH